MKLSRLIAAAAAGVIALTGMTACSNSASAPASDEEVTLTYSMWQQDQVATFEKMFDEFHKENPKINVKIQLTGFAQYFSKLQNEASNDTLPDVFWLNPYNFPLYASQGVIAPIDEKVKASGFDASQIPENMRDIYTWDQKLYSLPNNRDAITVWYNKKLFDAAGIAYPDPSWTWDDFRSIAKKLTNKSAGVWGTASSLDQGHVSVQTTVPQAGGYVLSEDKTKTGFGEKEAQQGIQFWTDLVADGSSPTLSDLAQTDMNSLFLSGKMGMLYQGSWFASQYGQTQLAKDGSIGVVTVPHGPKSNGTPSSSLGNVMPAKAKHPEESYKLIQFLGSKTAAEIYSKDGIGLTAYPSTDSNYVGKFNGLFDLKPVTAAVEEAFPLPASLNSSAWLKSIVDDLTPAFEQKASVADASAKLAKDMQGQLDQEKNLKK
ncbi:multiple sugar transport system substrate-binding protein [Arthrobacter sp. AG258]|uniref:ABC transporter substrate-binding protein n=1 Tax=Arthrobacter sp. AG258 TaxID=2183899 RepID=UPI00105CD97F|nr:sugar ABC transporter substrate-binding protein [Arthrobacter sp. AG258]TDT74703.1 multiple sugar transport system substrate-binding protein [Arthrobacter sp. AG258]